MLTEDKVRSEVLSTVKAMLRDLDVDSDRETVIERLNEECDSLFGSLVKHGRIDRYTVDDLVSTASDCAAIIKCAEIDSWVEDDHGLWDGLTYGVLASVAFFSLRNLLYSALVDLGVDSNDDQPLLAWVGKEC